MHDKYDTLQKELRLYGLQNGSSIGRHMGLMDEAADAIEIGRASCRERVSA